MGYWLDNSSHISRWPDAQKNFNTSFHWYKDEHIYIILISYLRVLELIACDVMANYSYLFCYCSSDGHLQTWLWPMSTSEQTNWSFMFTLPYLHTVPLFVNQVSSLVIRCPSIYVGSSKSFLIRLITYIGSYLFSSSHCQSLSLSARKILI